MKIKLTPHENYYLQKNGWIDDLVINADGYMDLNEDLIEEIREKSLQKQQIIGFDEEYKLTKEGLLLESIIDKLYF